MRNIAVTILALVALAFGCKVGDTRWCAVNNGTDEFVDVIYGGPEKEIRNLLANPCEDTPVSHFSFYTEDGDCTAAFISCHETDVAIMISLCAPYPVVINYSASSDGSGWTHVASGTKGKRAAERVRNAANVITARARQYNWNP